MRSSNERASVSSDITKDRTAPNRSKLLAKSDRKRIHRACDRCRIKKSKCNGQQPCNTCVSKERTCVFSTLRRRDIRKWHIYMQDVMDEAIQRLYRACIEYSSFPGTPLGDNEAITTENILRAMGFNNLDLSPKDGRVSDPILLSRSSVEHPQAPLPQQGRSIASNLMHYMNPYDDDLMFSSPQSTSQASTMPTRAESESAASISALLDMDEQFNEVVHRQVKARRLSYQDHEYKSWRTPGPETHYQSIPTQSATQTFTLLPASMGPLTYEPTAPLAHNMTETSPFHDGSQQSQDGAYSTYNAYDYGSFSAPNASFVS